MKSWWTTLTFGILWGKARRLAIPACALLAAFFNPAGAQEAASRWAADYFPDYELTDHHGKKVRFFSDLIKDRIVVINFIYTSCPDTCPLETSRLREIYALLEDRMGKDIFFYSITIDPKKDTVPVLKDYAERWEAGPGWTFLTGKEEEITHLRKKLGLLSVRDSVNLADHPVNIVMGNQKTGRWLHRTPFDTAPVLAEHLGNWLDNYRKPKEHWNDYANAPALGKLRNGEYIFRTRCASCHTIGQGDVISNSLVLIGPDLLGVGKRRDPDWLVRWIREPDVMIAERDPLALALLKQYREVPMPNFRLSDGDIHEVIGFIAAETELFLSGRQTAVEKMRAVAARVSTESEVMCPNCLKAMAATARKEADRKPQTWVPERPVPPPAKPQEPSSPKQ